MPALGRIAQVAEEFRLFIRLSSTPQTWHRADDIDCAGCLAYALGIPGALGGKKCTNGFSVTSWVSKRLANVTSALTELLTQINLETKGQSQILVLNYYQPIPPPSSFVSDGSQLCTLLAAHNATTYSEALIIQSALNEAILDAVLDAESAGIPNVGLVNIGNVIGGIGSAASHGMCTSQPWVFTGSLLNHWRAVHPNAEGQEAIASAIEAKL
jgi:hypothetical protein